MEAVPIIVAGEMIESIWGAGSSWVGWLASSTLGMKLKWLVRLSLIEQMNCHCLVLEPSVLGE